MYKQNVCQCVIWECKGCRHYKEDREEARAGEWVREKERERERERGREGGERGREVWEKEVLLLCLIRTGTAFVRNDNALVFSGNG